MFAQMADALASQNENPFKIVAYRKAAKVLADYPIDVEEAYRTGGIKALTAIPGIGAALSKKIAEFIDTGHMKKYEEVMSQKPKGG
jgi:DNA polymerase (family 10)